MTAKIIPCRFYEDPRGVRYSPFTSWKPADAVLIERGFTIAWPDGTTGCGRPPFETREEAEGYLAKCPNFSGMNSLGN